MTQSDPHLIHDYLSLSHSSLWEIQRKYFDHRGIEVFTKEVPFYVSSNRYIATRYAELVLTFIQGWLSQHPEAKDEPFYLLELGAGTGKFSFYFLKAFSEIVKQSDLKFEWRYIISDVVDKNLIFCQNNPSFKPFIEAGLIDFSNINIETDTDFLLKIENKPYSKLGIKSPLIVIANYVFDCLKQDIFTITKEGLKEYHLALKSRYENFDTDAPEHLDQLRFDFRAEPLEDIERHYENTLLNKLLIAYSNVLEEGVTFTMPIAAFDFIDRLRAHCEHLLLIGGDKGVTDKSHIPVSNANQQMTYDGCYSFLVNFHAIGSYCLNLGGSYLGSKKATNFKVNLCSLGFSLADFSAVNQFYQLHFETCGADEFCSLMANFEHSAYRFDLRGLLAFLRLSHWDPDIYCTLHDALLASKHRFIANLYHDVLQDLEKVKDNIYWLPRDPDPYHLLGIFYQTIGLNEKAIECYQSSIALQGDRPAPHHNLGIIYDTQKDVTHAVEHYEKAYTMNKHDQYAKQRLNRIKGNFFKLMLMPTLKLVAVLGGLAGLYWIFNQ